MSVDTHTDLQNRALGSHVSNYSGGTGMHGYGTATLRVMQCMQLQTLKPVAFVHKKKKGHGPRR
jgi:hypothetical protein